MPLFALAAQIGLAVTVTLVASRRSAPAWHAVRRVAAARGYRDALHRDVTTSFLPRGLLPHAAGAVLLGSIGAWPGLWAVHRMALLAARRVGTANTVDLRVVVAAGFALALLVVAAQALRLVTRRAGAPATARGVGGVAIALGALVALPMIAWPRLFGGGVSLVGIGGDAALAGSLGVLTAMAGAFLTRAAGLAERAELDLWSRPAVFDEG